jgi:hypothetical protein
LVAAITGCIHLTPNCVTQKIKDEKEERFIVTLGWGK